MARYFPFGRKKPIDTEKAKENLMKRYDGKHHRSSGMRFKRPSANLETIENRLLELEDAHHGHGKKTYLNPNGVKDHAKYTDMDTYYSTNKGYARRLVVQATPDVYEEPDYLPRHWGRRHIRGRVPFIITLAELCLNPLGLRRFDGVRVKQYEEEEDDMPRRQGNWILKTIIQTLCWIPLMLRTVVISALHWIISILLTLTLSWIIPVVLSVEICTSPWSENDTTEPYKKYQNVHWHWPKHAMNLLDQYPKNDQRQSKIGGLTIPTRLVVKDRTTNQWAPRKTDDLRDEKTGMLQPYIFLSFSRANYLGKSKEELRKMLYQVAERMLRHENESLQKDPQDPPLEAFWVDVDCVSSDESIPDGEVESERTRDINTICDAVRCAKRVYVVLPTESAKDKGIWGERIWTFPEVLLAANRIRYCFTHSTSMSLSTPHALTLNDMKISFWRPESNSNKIEEDAIGLLINHYTNSLQLSELQLFTFAVQAMAKQTTSVDTKGYTTRDMAYAAMGLLSYRLTPNDSDTVFQAIARLSIVNDSNQLLERLLCLWPSPKSLTVDALPALAPAGSETILRNIADQDQYGTHLWDIKPLCDVVGVGNDLHEPTVIVDRCRGIPIRWKNFPRLNYAKDLTGMRASISQKIMYFAIIYAATGFSLFSSAIALLVSTIQFQSELKQPTIDLMQIIRQTIVPNYLVTVGLYFGVAWIISWFSPWAVRKLCNDSGCSNHLVGFEGTMPLHDLEKTIYGNFNNRLSYTASSTVFSGKLRRDDIRMSEEPDDKNYWKNRFQELGLPKTHRIFTIVDTGDMTVSVISAERPPVVALISGREGGMLRVLLCSWRFENNCLYREGVVRMRSSLEEQATRNDWLKISLASQGDANRTRLVHLKKKQSSASSSS
ncbi:hypothetical protein N7537_010807 [Penicillium hordei]|uniref:Heterokaryon incompatibility domain-containing protein n=1 Tax=Penicillium hordei TaxID=40994 RepID=A0AAD6DM41_9EURO|nr:uncharacterized protein N7537_010807 [Penicillium hordei]KAJ5588129.1 hypothetical protein N7537_010807 [Penicillium hordei]